MPERMRVRAERVEVRLSREHILSAAAAHYAEHSADPTMAELAVAAGVGNATLYRRFPSIEDVVRALYARTLEYQQAVADDMLRQESGWDAVVTLITGIAAAILEHPEIPRVTRRMIEIEPERTHGAQWDGDLKAVTRRAQEEGALRPDVDSNDLTLAAFRMGEYGYLPPDARARIVARQVVIVLDGLRAGAARTAVPGSGISTEEIQTFFRRRMG